MVSCTRNDESMEREKQLYSINIWELVNILITICSSRMREIGWGGISFLAHAILNNGRDGRDWGRPGLQQNQGISFKQVKFKTLRESIPSQKKYK